MKKISKKYAIKIPSDLTVIYSNNKKKLILIGSYKQRSINLKTEIILLKSQNSILVTDDSISKIPNNLKKNLKSVQGTTISLIKQLMVETSAIFYQRLKLIGVGYRVFEIENFQNRLLLFKLGYSHSIYFKMPKELQFFILKLTKLIIYGNSYQMVNQITSIIRSNKMPEPYKGKGILYENEKILLKEGKKI